MSTIEVITAILHNLKKAREELDGLVSELEQDDDFDFDGYYVAMQHIYHHLNMAWNIRNEEPKRIQRCAEDDFIRWRRFPNDFDMSCLMQGQYRLSSRIEVCLCPYSMPFFYRPVGRLIDWAWPSG